MQMVYSILIVALQPAQENKHHFERKHQRSSGDRFHPGSFSSACSSSSPGMMGIKKENAAIH
jgi:hypothetical protein